MKATLVEAWKRPYADGKAVTFAATFDVDGEVMTHGVRLNQHDVGEDEGKGRALAARLLHVWITEVVGPAGEVIYPDRGIEFAPREPWSSNAPA